MKLRTYPMPDINKSYHFSSEKKAIVLYEKLDRSKRDLTAIKLPEVRGKWYIDDLTFSYEAPIHWAIKVGGRRV